MYQLVCVGGCKVGTMVCYRLWEGIRRVEILNYDMVCGNGVAAALQL